MMPKMLLDNATYTEPGREVRFVRTVLILVRGVAAVRSGAGPSQPGAAEAAAGA